MELIILMLVNTELRIIVYHPIKCLNSAVISFKSAR